MNMKTLMAVSALCLLLIAPAVSASAMQAPPPPKCDLSSDVRECVAYAASVADAWIVFVANLICKNPCNITAIH